MKVNQASPERLIKDILFERIWLSQIPVLISFTVSLTFF